MADTYTKISGNLFKKSTDKIIEETLNVAELQRKKEIYLLKIAEIDKDLSEIAKVNKQ